MTVGAPDQLCRCPVHCTPGPAGRLARAELGLRARYYAEALTDGEDIDGDIGGVDAEYIAPFAQYLPEALIAAGFSIHARLERGRVITTVRKPKETT